MQIQSILTAAMNEKYDNLFINRTLNRSIIRYFLKNLPPDRLIPPRLLKNIATLPKLQPINFLQKTIQLVISENLILLSTFSKVIFAVDKNRHKAPLGHYPGISPE